MRVATLTTFAEQSPALDRGDETSPFGLEPSPNGAFVNLGAYGNTPQASLSPPAYVFLVGPDGGESALVNAPPVELVDSLLYYVARSTSQDPRIEALRKQYNLAEVLPQPTQIEQARDGLSGPSVRLMRTVAQAIKEDLGTVKDALDIFVRTGMQGRDKLGPQLDMLKKIGDTLGVLGLDKARGQIQRRMSGSSAPPWLSECPPSPHAWRTA